MDISIEKEVEVALGFDEEALIRDVIIGALDYAKCPYECTVSVLLTDNKAIHEMNLEYRGIDRPTDVLSFPLVDYETPGDFSHLEEDGDLYFDPDSGELMLGDIVISIDKVKEQAAEYGHSEKRELAFLIAHSVLHLCGYDHMEQEERMQMEQMQEEILQQLMLTREMV